MTIEETIKQAISAQMSQIMKPYRVKKLLTLTEVWEQYGEGYKDKKSFGLYLKTIGVPYRGTSKNKLFERAKVESIFFQLEEKV